MLSAPIRDRDRRLLLALAALAGTAAPAVAQTTLTWNTAADGNWSNPLNWTPNGVPNNAGPNTFNAVIGLAGLYTVTLDIDATIQNYTQSGVGAILNLGNMHLLGFPLAGRRIASLFEHHTGELKPPAIEQMTRRMVDGSLTDSEVFNSKGHGGYHADRSLVSGALPTAIAVTGPRRDVIRQTALPVCMAAPFGDMMISGCFGLLRGFAEVYPKAADAIASRLGELP